MKQIAFVLACLIGQELSAQVMPLPAPGDTTRVRFDATRNAERDINAAIEQARKTGKNILVDVGGEWCGWCRKLDKFYLENRDVDEYLHQHFVEVKVNYSKENKNVEVLSRYPAIKGYPHYFVLAPDGKLLHSQETGALESGNHHDRDKVLAFLEAWSPGAKPDH